MTAALGTMHAQFAAQWTLPVLAGKASMSRSNVAQVFKATVGSSSMEYPTR